MMISFNREQPDKPVVKITALTSDESTNLKFQPLVITRGKSPPFPPTEPAAKLTITLDPERLGKAE
jgi:hypothetical protein